MRKCKLSELSISPLLLLQKWWAGVQGVCLAPHPMGARCSGLHCPPAWDPPEGSVAVSQPAPLPVLQPHAGDARGSPAPPRAERQEQAGLVLVGSPWARVRCLQGSRRSGV